MITLIVVIVLNLGGFSIFPHKLMKRLREDFIELGMLGLLIAALPPDGGWKGGMGVS